MTSDSDTSSCLTVKERIGELLKTDNQDIADCEFEFADKVKVTSLYGIAQQRDMLHTKSSILKAIKSHKNILSIASPVFKAMLYGELRITSGPQTIKEMESTVFKKMLEFIYTDNVELDSVEMACGVYTAGEKFLLPRLKDFCEGYIINSINVSDLFYLLDFLKIYRNKNIYDECINFIRSNTKSILNDDILTNLDSNKLLIVITQPALNIDSEFELFLAVERWANKKADEKGVSVREIATTMHIIKNIRFLSMKHEDFAKGPGKSEMLTSDEQLSLALNILSPGVCSIPQNVCPLRKHRPARVKYQYRFTDLTSCLRNGMNSPEFHVKQFMWKLCLSGENNDYHGFAVLHIEYRGISGSDRSSCSASVQLKFLPHEKGYQPIKKSFKQHFCMHTNTGFAQIISSSNRNSSTSSTSLRNEISHLHPVEIKWSIMFDKNCQFIKNDGITVEAIVEPDPEPEDRVII